MDGGTARAAEGLAACLQDRHRTVVIGERTAGNVGSYRICPLEGGQLRFTSAIMVRPTGKNLSRMMTTGRDDEDWGVLPDRGFEIKLTPGESTALREHLRGWEIIPRRDGAPEPARAEFKDRQLARTVESLLGTT